MVKLSLVLIGCAWLVLAGGCATMPLDEQPLVARHRFGHSAQEWKEIEKLLPAGMSLDSQFAMSGSPSIRATVPLRRVLEEVGIQAKDGKLVDLAGQEVYLYP